MRSLVCLLLVLLSCGHLQHAQVHPLSQVVQVRHSLTVRVMEGTTDGSDLGSGTVIAARHGHSLVLTAGHVVWPPENASVVSESFSVSDVNGNVCPAEVV